MRPGASRSLTAEVPLPVEKDAGGRRRARRYAMEKCAERALDIYGSLVGKEIGPRNVEDSLWAKTRRWIKAEWDLVSNLAEATTSAIEKK